MMTFFSWLFGAEEVLLYVLLALMCILTLGAIVWGIKEYYRKKRSLTGMHIFPSVTASHVPHDDRIDYAGSFIEQIAPKIAWRNGVFSPSIEQSTHILSIILNARRGSINGRHAFIIDASVSLQDRRSNIALAHGNVSVDDRQQIRYTPPVRNSDGRIISTGHRYVSDEEQWGTTPEGRVRGLNMLAEKVLHFIDSNRAVRLLVEKAKEAEDLLRKAEAEQSRRGNQPS